MSVYADRFNPVWTGDEGEPTTRVPRWVQESIEMLGNQGQTRNNQIITLLDLITI